MLDQPVRIESAKTPPAADLRFRIGENEAQRPARDPGARPTRPVVGRIMTPDVGALERQRHAVDDDRDAAPRYEVGAGTAMRLRLPL